jgi:hypothetical protein
VRRADHSSRGVLPCVCMCVWSRNLVKGSHRSILDYKRLWMIIISGMYYSGTRNRCSGCTAMTRSPDNGVHHVKSRQSLRGWTYSIYIKWNYVRLKHYVSRARYSTVSNATAYAGARKINNCFEQMKGVIFICSAFRGLGEISGSRGAEVNFYKRAQNI